MAIPEKCTVLVVGGGPGGSYAAAALAREGIDTVLLEADVFPRYHIGESMLASMRHFLRFIDLDSTFDKYGFTRKVGAAFKLNGTKREGYTDFLAAGGPENYAWNVVRAEADDLMFRHAGKSGAKIFDGVKVSSVDFTPSRFLNGTAIDHEATDLGRPVSAAYSRKSDGASGTIKFDYVVDASGRMGLLSTKYLKNRKYNQGLKNIANWGYWKNTGAYASGTARENSPFFEALQDESGWAWLIPLHNGTTSVGIVQNQDLATSKKKAMGSPTTKDFYMESLKLAPAILELISDGEVTTDIKSASDYSYSSSSYAFPYARIVGDAGCFIDPYFSSGVHLALMGGLSAAMTICASMKGDVDEVAAAKWHSNKVADGYTRFLLVVLSAYKQIRRQEEAVLSDFDEDNFDRAFAFFRPIIQGTADVSTKLSQAELSKTLDFCTNAFEPTLPEERAAVMEKLGTSGTTKVETDEKVKEKSEAFQANLTAEEERVMKHIRARQMMRTEDTLNIASFSTDIIDGYASRLERGNLGLVKIVPAEEPMATNGMATGAMPAAVKV
ncbi:hypothetical protein B7494_g6309 [Chlorociboria aeruginascens]|nr:hypothetical protein B7494_g6309 [Chlorociboria aeruginascens]